MKSLWDGWDGGVHKRLPTSGAVFTSLVDSQCGGPSTSLLGGTVAKREVSQCDPRSGEIQWSSRSPSLLSNHRIRFGFGWRSFIRRFPTHHCGFLSKWDANAVQLPLDWSYSPKEETNCSGLSTSCASSNAFASGCSLHMFSFFWCLVFREHTPDRSTMDD